MNRVPAPLALVLAVVLLAAGCSQAAPTPTAAPAAPTSAPAAQPKAVEPTKAPVVSAPTAAPDVKKVDYPQNGKPITAIVPFGAGGGADINARALAAVLQKELGVPINIVNKAGASTQIGMTGLVNSPADGYTIALTVMPTHVSAYLDPKTPATYSQKDLQVIARTAVDPSTIEVKSDSTIKSLKDLVDAAKAKPGEVSLAIGGLLSGTHLVSQLLQKASGAQFREVIMQDGNQAMTTVLGGHTDAGVNNGAEVSPHFKSGTIRVLAITDSQPSEFLPGVPTAQSQGYNVLIQMAHIVVVRAGTPKEVVDVLSGAVKRAAASDEYKKMAAQLGLNVRYLDGADLTSYISQVEGAVGPVLKEYRDKNQ